MTPGLQVHLLKQLCSDEKQALDSQVTGKEIIGIVSRRKYYASAGVRVASVRSGNDLMLVGGWVILSDRPPAETITLDYGSLLLLEGSLPVKAFDDWTTRLTTEGRLLFLLPNMEAKVDRVNISSKNVGVSVVAGKGSLESLKGKLYVQEAYTGSYRPALHKDLTFPSGTVEVPLGFKPGYIYLTLL